MAINENTKPRQLYVTSKEFTEGRILIGILTELSEGNYQFEYKLDGKAQEWHLPIKEFPDVKKVYNGSDVERFINRLIPPKHGIYPFNSFIASSHMSEYDVWELLKAFGERGDSRSEVFLFEKLHERIVTYEPVEKR